MKKIALYNGVGSQVSKDIEFFLNSKDLLYSKINHSEIQKGGLENHDVFIVGGGSVFDIVPALQHSGVFEIQQFVRNGGKYIGICAGAYIAANQYYDTKGFGYRGLKLVDVVFKRGKGEEVVGFNFVNSKNQIKLYYSNGPVLYKINDDSKIIAQNENRELVIIEKQLGKGEVVLFSAHPEGNSEKQIRVEDLGSAEFFMQIIVN